MSTFQLPHQPKYSSYTEYDLSNLEAVEIPDVSGVIRDLIINEEALKGILDKLVEELQTAQGIFNTYTAEHAEQDSLKLQEGFDDRCGVYSTCYYALSDIEREVQLVVSAIEELNQYPGMAQELWEAVQGKEFAPMTGAFIGSLNKTHVGADGIGSNVALGAITHVDQLVELVKKVNTWIDYTAGGANKIGEAVQWLQAEVARQEDEDKKEIQPEV